MTDIASLATLGLLLILTGFAIVFVAAIILLFSSANAEKKARGGGVIIVGPFPIVFGTDKKSVMVLLVLSIALMAIVLLVYIFSNYFWKR